MRFTRYEGPYRFIQNRPPASRSGSGRSSRGELTFAGDFLGGSI